ncbi:hypothetical protein [Clostridium oryzae]|uniref:Uncharacterized protein n=1 Tax=Clostridium oryzae TaxID=1450648 RepID=A0A1V4IEL4_9CLOT|nr:hypothetical protein [Clostridium oryzae]OPJ57977.1 hypothetical protein CLORY_38290 [Clostridium oryzae]
MNDMENKTYTLVLVSVDVTKDTLVKSSTDLIVIPYIPIPIRNCLYKYVYIWTIDGEAFWVYLTHVDTDYAMGYKWINNAWQYFQIEHFKIDSYKCFSEN